MTLRTNTLLLAGLLTLSACTTSPTPPTQPQPGATTKAALGVYELSLSGDGKTARQASVRAQANEVGGLSFQSVQYGYTVDSQNNSTVAYATFDVTNNSGTDIIAPTLVPIDTAGTGGTVGYTAFRELKTFGGADASSKAAGLTYTQGTNQQGHTTPLVTSLDSGSITGINTGTTQLAGTARSGWVMPALTNGATGRVTVAIRIPGTDAQQNPFSFNMVFTVADNVPQTSTLTNIGTVQGSTPSGDGVTPGGTPTIEGVVTYTSFDAAGKVQGFFVQEEGMDADTDVTTSDGVFVYCGSTCDVTIKAGDRVRVIGTASERFTNTQIAGTLTVTKLMSGLALPDAAELTLPLPVAQRERYEGMRVHVTGIVNSNYQLGRGGLVDIADSRPISYTQENAPSVAGFAQFNADLAARTIRIDDGSQASNESSVEFARNGGPLSVTNILRTGDSADVTGVMTYTFDGWSGSPNAYRIFSTQQDAKFGLTAVNERPAAPADVMAAGTANARVASMNVENFFTTMQTNNTGCTPNGVDASARGPVNCDEYARKLDKMVNVVRGLDADVIGLNELQNYGKYASEQVPTVQLLVNELNTRLSGDIYAAVLPGRTIGTDVIAVGYIYKKAAFSPVGTLGVLDNTFNATYTDTCNRPTMAQTFQSNTNGGRFTLVIAHLKSKGSACSALGDADTLDGQGGGYRARLNAASLIHNWLATNPTGTAESDVVVMGDMNAYLAEPPVQVILNGPDGQKGTADDFLTQFGPESYSYQYNASFGSLDHAFASPSFASQIVGKTKWHINADEALPYKPDFQFKAVPGCPSGTSCTGPDLYSSGPFATSDHDPILLGVNLTAQTPLPTTPPPAPIASVTMTPNTATATVKASDDTSVNTTTANFTATGTNTSGPLNITVTPQGSAPAIVTAPTTATSGNPFTVTVTANASTTPGTYTYAVQAENSGKTATSTLTITVQSGTVTPPASGGVYFSEYVEGSSNNKAIEIFNGTGQDIPAGQLVINLYTNGTTTASNPYTVNVMLAAGKTFVIANSAAGATLLAKADATGGVTNFNGDDALSLYYNGVLVDTFGQIGFDPGAAWTANGVTTVDRTLRRKTSVTAGDANSGDAFDPSVEWESYAIDTFDGLGLR